MNVDTTAGAARPIDHVAPVDLYYGTGATRPVKALQGAAMSRPQPRRRPSPDRARTVTSTLTHRRLRDPFTPIAKDSDLTRSRTALLLGLLLISMSVSGARDNPPASNPPASIGTHGQRAAGEERLESEKPIAIPGKWRITPQPMPPPAEIVKKGTADGRVFGLYAWATVYRKYRDDIKRIGWKAIRIGGPINDEDMKMFVEDDIDVLKTVSLSDGATPGKQQKKTRADYSSDEAFIDDYLNVIENLLVRYGPGGSYFRGHPQLPVRPIRSVEIGNEPNAHFLIPHRRPLTQVAAERERLYAKLLPAAYRLIKSRWPNVTVVGFAAAGGNGMDIEFIDHVLSTNPKIADSFDVLSTHPYVQPSPPETDRIRDWGIYSMAKSLARIRDLMDRHGVPEQIPVWYTELGWSISREQGGTFAMKQEEFVSPLLQAAYVCRTYALAMRLGVPRVFIMFISDADGFNGGFVVGSGQWRPSAQAVQTMLSNLPKPRLTSAISDGADGYYAYRFISDTSSDTLSSTVMAWSVTGPRNVKIPWQGDTARVTEMLGDTRTVHAESGMLSLHVGPYPLYIRQ